MWQYYRDDRNDNREESELFKLKMNITGKSTATGNTKDFKITVHLKYLSNFWRALEMLLTNCETNLILIWSENYVIFAGTGATKIKVKDAKLYVSVVTLSAQDNRQLLQKLNQDSKAIN